MHRWIAFLILFVFVNLPGQQPQSTFYRQLYSHAEKIFNDPATSEKKDSLALQAYLTVIRLHPLQPDSILFDSYYKVAICLQTEENFHGATPFLKNAITVHGQLRYLSDSLLYLPFLYLGNSYYNESLLDSAVFFYAKAETITRKYPGIAGIERLYNTMGAVNYESGNYLQSILYFRKALQTIHNKSNIPLEVTYKSNLAGALRKTGALEESMAIYMDLLKYGTNRKELLHNIGSTYLKKDSALRAISFFKRGDMNDPGNLNDIALSFLALKNRDSAIHYIRKSFALNEKINGQRKNIPAAVTYKLCGDFYLSDNQPDTALKAYQSGISQLIFDFNDKNPQSNPTHYEGQFSVAELFELLTGKAKAFKLKYDLRKDTSNLKHSLDAYSSLYSFTNYILRTYESADARLFLGSRRQPTHNEAIAICLQLHTLTGNRIFMERAFRYDEQNKATVLLLDLLESHVKQSGGVPDSLLRQENQLKQKITRLSLNVSVDSDQQHKTALLDANIQLASLQKSFEDYPTFRKFRTEENNINLKAFINSIPANTAVLSYHLGDSSILGFLLTKDNFDYFTSPIADSFSSQVTTLEALAAKADENNQQAIDCLSTSLYKKLILPVEQALRSFDHLMIIPDDELNILPFEILRDNNGHYLIQSHDITYNYSCAVLDASVAASAPLTPALGMAPFVKRDAHTFSKQDLPVLTESDQEIKVVPGQKLLGQNATKQAFLQQAGKFRLLHLATHAMADDIDPSRSYIAFFRDHSNDALSYRLYSREIVDLRLERTNLVILSACETGTGKLIKGEGMLSLTRAFTFAGCPNTIASLWKANDASTSLILQKFYKQLHGTGTISRSMQSAINDYLRDEEIPSRLKTPAYWAHLRVVGNFAVDDQGIGRNAMGMVILALTVLSIFVYKRAAAAGKRTIH